MSWYKRADNQRLYFAVLGLLVDARNSPGVIINVNDRINSIMPNVDDVQALQEAIQRAIPEALKITGENDLTDHQNEILRLLQARMGDGQMANAPQEQQHPQVQQPIEPNDVGDLANVGSEASGL